MPPCIAVFSDTHGDASAIERAMKCARSADSVVHLGDYVRDAEMIGQSVSSPFFFVAGNNDLGSDAPRSARFMIGGLTVFAVHGHQHGVKWGMERLMFAGRESEAGLVLFGHTHLSRVDNDGLCVYVNPGAASGAHATYALIEFGGGVIVPRIFKL